MKTKFLKFWANTKIQETIVLNNENEIVENRNEGIITDDLMNTGFLKDMYLTSTHFNTILYMISYYLNRPETFQYNELPAVDDPYYVGRIITMISQQNTKVLLFSDGQNWNPIKFDNIG